MEEVGEVGGEGGGARKCQDPKIIAESFHWLPAVTDVI